MSDYTPLEELGTQTYWAFCASWLPSTADWQSVWVTKEHAHADSLEAFFGEVFYPEFGDECANGMPLSGTSEASLDLFFTTIDDVVGLIFATRPDDADSADFKAFIALLLFRFLPQQVQSLTFDESRLAFRLLIQVPSLSWEELQTAIHEDVDPELFRSLIGGKS
jgi:hypothetical protein